MEDKFKMFAVGLSVGLLIALFAYVNGESKLLERNEVDSYVIACNVDTKELCIVQSEP